MWCLGWSDFHDDRMWSVDRGCGRGLRRRRLCGSRDLSPDIKVVYIRQRDTVHLRGLLAIRCCCGVHGETIRFYLRRVHIKVSHFDGSKWGA